MFYFPTHMAAGHSGVGKGSTSAVTHIASDARWRASSSGDVIPYERSVKHAYERLREQERKSRGWRGVGAFCSPSEPTAQDLCCDLVRIWLSPQYLKNTGGVVRSLFRRVCTGFRRVCTGFRRC